MPDQLFRPIPANLYETVEPAAGDVYPVSRHRRRAEFDPNWTYICSPDASPEAVAAALHCSAYDVPDGMWTKVIAVHCPQAKALMDNASVSWDDFNEGHVNVEVSNQISRAINEALGGWEVVKMFPFADIMDSIDKTIGVPINFA